jgi:hypothetical protein
MPERVVSLTKAGQGPFTYFNLYIWGGSLDYKDRMSLHLEDGIFSHADFMRAPDGNDVPYQQRRSAGAGWRYLACESVIKEAEEMLAGLPGLVEDARNGILPLVKLA